MPYIIFLGILLLLSSSLQAMESKIQVAEQIESKVEHQDSKELAAKIASLKAVQLARLQDVLSDSLLSLYQWYGPYTLYVPKDVLSSLAVFKEFFEKAVLGGFIQFSAKDFNLDADWSKNFKRFNYALEDVTEDDLDVVASHKLESLLRDAKAILKAYLLTDAQDVLWLREHCLKKTNLRRLFTHAWLQRVISKKGFSHVTVPLKNLVIVDKKTGNYITGEAASKIIDSIVTIQLDERRPKIFLSIADHRHDDYDFFILAHKQISSENPLSKVALEELAELIKEAPFDLGWDNIFSDSRGDAIIIDTEFHGERASHCLPKLQRYNHIGVFLSLS